MPRIRAMCVMSLNHLIYFVLIFNIYIYNGLLMGIFNCVNISFLYFFLFSLLTNNLNVNWFILFYFLIDLCSPGLWLSTFFSLLGIYVISSLNLTFPPFRLSGKNEVVPFLPFISLNILYLPCIYQYLMYHLVLYLWP